MAEQQPEAGVREKKTTQFPCPSCGGNMYFDPETGTMHCPYCDKQAEFGRKEDEIIEYDLFSAREEEKDGDWGAKTVSIVCENCGARTVVDRESIARFCAFCGSSRIISAEEVTGVAPESVLPFTVTEEKARDAFRKWIRRRYFAPRALRKENRLGTMAGAYVPYWTYDADTFYTYTAQAGDYYYVTRTRRVNGRTETYQERKIRWRFVSGSGNEYFDDIPVPATRKMDMTLVTKLEPFPLKKLKPYQPEYLSGFVAERYSVPLQEGWNTAKIEIRHRLEDIVRKGIRADEVRDIRLMTNYNKVLYKQLLVPVWISSYQYRGKTFQCLVNGSTGKVAGRAPVSAVKVILTVLGVIAVIALALWLYSRYGG